MSNWSHNKLSNLGFVGRGRSKHRPRNDPSLYNGNYPFVQTSNIKAADLYLSEYTQTYNQKGLAQSKLWEPGTLCITIAANIAETAILKIKACFPDSVVGFVADPDKADTRFIKYYINTIKLRMQNISKGTTQDNLSLDKLMSFDFVVPSVKVQQKIASILSAYDDLIDNNLKRIKILEEIAQMIYREWFVNFRFPGREKIKMVKSEMGMIPEGWETKNLGDVCNVVMGQSPKSEYYNTEGNGLPFHQGVKDFGSRFLTHNTYCTVESRIAEQGEILISVRAPVGRINIASEKLIIGRGLSAIRHKHGQQSFLLYQLKHIFREEDSMGSGTIYRAITKDDLLNIKIIQPSREFDNNFNDLVSPMDAEIENLTMRIETLRKIRDLLLPKLISGEIDLENMDIDTEAS